MKAMELILFYCTKAAMIGCVAAIVNTLSVTKQEDAQNK
jgi:hypothetical protein